MQDKPDIAIVAVDVEKELPTLEKEESPQEVIEEKSEEKELFEMEKEQNFNDNPIYVPLQKQIINQPEQGAVYFAPPKFTPEQLNPTQQLKPELNDVQMNQQQVEYAPDQELNHQPNTPPLIRPQMPSQQVIPQMPRQIHQQVIPQQMNPQMIPQQMNPQMIPQQMNPQMIPHQMIPHQMNQPPQMVAYQPVYYASHFDATPRDSIIPAAMMPAQQAAFRVDQPRVEQMFPETDTDSISDFSDTGSIHSSVVANAPLGERMERMKARCKKLKSPQSGYAAAQFIIQNVQFLDKNDQISYCEIAIKTLRKLSNQVGHSDAAVALGHLYVRGIPGFQNGHKADYAKAFQCYSSCAKKDHTEGSFHLALCYEHGLGTQQSNSRAFQWYRKAAVNNHPGAMFRMSSALLKGELGQKKDARDGLKWLKLAAKYANEQYPQALYDLAMLHDQGLKSLVWPDHKYMVELLTRASELQHAPSQFTLGQAYEYGRYACEKNPAKSIYFYSLAASNSHVEAMFELGGWYLVGSSDPKTDFVLPQSDLEAYKWVKRAAERDLPRAMFAMGYFCEMGIGHLRQDPDEAWKWYGKAAQAGDPKAVEKLKESKGSKVKLVKSASRPSLKGDAAPKVKDDKCVIM